MKPKSNFYLRCHNVTELIILSLSLRLVTHSPLPRSSSCSPVEYSDPHTSTLLQLLKNISEEVEDQIPQIPTATASGVKLAGCKSPLASLNSKLQELAASRSTSPNVQRGPMGNLIAVKAKSTSPPKVVKEIPTKKSLSLDDCKNTTNNVEPMKSGNCLGDNLKPPASEAEQMMPLIQITLTESQEKKKYTADTPSSSSLIEGIGRR